MALTSVSNVRLEELAEDHPFLKKYVKWVSISRYEAISAILVGNNLVNVASSAVATALSTVIFRSHGVAVAVLVMSVLIIIFGEVLPKCIAMARSEQFLVVGLPIIKFFSLTFKPVIVFMESFVDVIGRITGVSLSFNDSFVTREEIGEVIKIGEASGVIEKTERQMIDSVISFDEIKVSEIMVPRTKMCMLESTVTVDEALLYIQQKGMSRIPIYTGDADHINGIVLAKDLLAALMHGKHQDRATSYMRSPLFVPETMYVPKLFRLMQNSRMHMAMVVDEYGGTAGLVTLEDLVEEIVGDIQDEYDKDYKPIVRNPDGSYKVQGDVPLEMLNKALDGCNFECEEVDTLGGLLVYSFGNFPKKGDSLTLNGWSFEITDMGEHKINYVNVKKIEPAQGENSDDD